MHLKGIVHWECWLRIPDRSIRGRASGEGTKAVREVEKSRLSKQKTLRKQYTGRMVCQDKAKIKGKTRKTCPHVNGDV